MTGALWIAVAVLVVWVILGIFDKHRSEKTSDEALDDTVEPGYVETAEGDVCCGTHSVCVRMLPVPERPVYFDDEELDRFAGRKAGEYSDDETEEFRDVMLTLAPDEAPEWAQSLNMRGIEVPDGIMDELSLLVTEELSARS